MLFVVVVLCLLRVLLFALICYCFVCVIWLVCVGLVVLLLLDVVVGVCLPRLWFLICVVVLLWFAILFCELWACGSLLLLWFGLW